MPIRTATIYLISKPLHKARSQLVQIKNLESVEITVAIRDVEYAAGAASAQHLAKRKHQRPF